MHLSIQFASSRRCRPIQQQRLCGRRIQQAFTAGRIWLDTEYLSRSACSADYSRRPGKKKKSDQRIKPTPKGMGISAPRSGDGGATEGNPSHSSPSTIAPPSDQGGGAQVTVHGHRCSGRGQQPFHHVALATPDMLIAEKRVKAFQ